MTVKLFDESMNEAREVAELRKEIAALRAELAPVPSLIVTGRQALDEFKRLTPNALGEGRERGILREASSGEAATSTDGLEGKGRSDAG